MRHQFAVMLEKTGAAQVEELSPALQMKNILFTTRFFSHLVV
jgi:hypothetical protein